MSEKLHYYLFPYESPTGVGSLWCAFNQKNLTRSALKSVVSAAVERLPHGTKVVVTGASYLGYMTPEEFMDDKDD
jgi:hypothetical protein